MITSEHVSNRTRRKFLQWIAPVVAVVTLPSHGQTSICDSVPLVNALAPSKCSGVPGSLIGVATLTVTSSNSNMTINSITHNAPAGNTITLPALPAEVTSTIGAFITWTGPGTDVFICLPNNPNPIIFTIDYSCDGSASNTASFNLDDILVAAL